MFVKYLIYFSWLFSFAGKWLDEKAKVKFKINGGTQKITINILRDISKSKDDQTANFDENDFWWKIMLKMSKHYIYKVKASG